MPGSVEDQIQRAELRLQRAMLEGDVAALDTLIASDLLFTNHLGQILNKQDDLDLYRVAGLRFDALDHLEWQIKGSDDAPVTLSRLKLSGSFGDNAFQADLRLTRIWRQAANGDWQLYLMHSSPVAA